MTKHSRLWGDPGVSGGSEKHFENILPSQFWDRDPRYLKGGANGPICLKKNLFFQEKKWSLGVPGVPLKTGSVKYFPKVFFWTSWVPWVSPYPHKLCNRPKNLKKYPRGCVRVELVLRFAQLSFRYSEIYEREKWDVGLMAPDPVQCVLRASELSSQICLLLPLIHSIC